MVRVTLRQPYALGKIPRYPLDRKLNAQGSVVDSVEKALLPLVRIEPRFLDRPTRRPLAILTDLSRFLRKVTILPSFPSTLQLRVSFGLLNNLPPFFSVHLS
jgi:hypothetical protein